ncbi:MAG: ABC transporter ATP-binding protein [Pirellulales bacterium]|nr:ABC transporter ATP-binding protein [Pirellulales bacterium]
MSDLARELPPGVPLLEARQLRRVYPSGNVNAVRDVSLRIERGDYLAIMGPSGSGKSTLLNLLGGLDVPNQGEVRFAGRPLAEFPSLDAFRSREVGFVFQSFHLLPTLTALQNVQVPMFEGALRAAQRRARAAELLETVGLGHRLHHRAMQLSIGERQRVAIARALANRPSLLLADEPTGSLDSHTSEEVLNLFARLHREQELTLIVVTHSPQVAAAAARVVWFRDGQLAPGPDVNVSIPDTPRPSTPAAR